MKLKIFALAATLLLILSGLTQAVESEVYTGETSLIRQDQIQSVTSDKNSVEIEASAFNHPSGTPLRDEGQGDLLWNAGFENAITEHVALSADGRWAAIGHYLNDERFELRNAEDGEIAITMEVDDGPSYVAISEDGGRAAFAASGNVWVFDHEQGVEPVFQINLGGMNPGPIAMSRDGRTLIATGSDVDNRLLRAWCYLEDEQAWTYDADMDTAYNWQGVTLSRDGSVVALTAKFYLYVLDVANGDGIWGTRTYNSEAPVALDNDCSVIALGSLTGRLTVYHREPRGRAYQELWHYSFRGARSTWVNSVALSDDGLTLAAGTLDFYDDHYEGRLALFDTYGNSEPLWVNDQFLDEVAGVAISDNGGIIAASCWGDFDHQTPDLVLHERHNSEPFYELNTPGSLTGVSMSGNGLFILSGGKGTHNREFGRGGNVYMVEAALPGGYVTGTITDQDGAPLQGVVISADDNPYETTTDEDGNYRLLIEVDGRRDVAVRAHKRGYFYGDDGVEIERGETVEGIDIELRRTDPVWAEVWASLGERNLIQLEVVLIDGPPSPHQDQYITLSATDAPPITSSTSVTPWVSDEIKTQTPRRDPQRDVESYNIYRSFISGGPYTLIGSVETAERMLFIDRENIFPQRDYYYVISADFGDGESEFSEEDSGWMADDFLIYDADLEDMDMPDIDGTINDGEWDGAMLRDISDVFGYDAPDSAGTTEAYIGFDDDTDNLLIAIRYYNVEQLHNQLGVGVYVDDDHSGAWTYARPGSEGNYWAYWIDNEERQGPDLRYRSLTLAPYNVDPYYSFEDAQLEFSDERGYVELEMAIPLGFHAPYEVAVYQPDFTIGLGLFSMHRDDVGAAIFDGWWPQDMLSIVSYPSQFGTVHIPVHLSVPPVAPENVNVSRDNDDLYVEWIDPTEGIDNGDVQELAGISVFRNDEHISDEDPQTEEYFDEDVLPSGWYEYSLAGYILENDEPFHGPLSEPVGMYAGAEPDIRELVYDDGSAEGWYVVSFNWNDNRFGVRLDIEGDEDTVAIYWIEFPANDTDPLNLYIAEDDNGVPGDIIGGRFRTSPKEVGQFHRFHFPEVQQPRVVLDQFGMATCWIIIHYTPESPGSPGIGVDQSNVDGDRNMYHLADRGWQPFPNGQLMVRAGIGIPPVDAPPIVEPAIPVEFSIGQNFPNPFNSLSLLPINLPLASVVEINLYDLNGRTVMNRQLGELSAGRHIAELSSERLTTGVYFAQVATATEKRVIKIAVLK